MHLRNRPLIGVGFQTKLDAIAFRRYKPELVVSIPRQVLLLLYFYIAVAAKNCRIYSSARYSK